ncbi:MAG: PilZ domain-containing protein [Pyrinomonadaceae bacterium]|nr:PilZ domain-containing protein [Pyrinomonadaceae bacterium]
MSNEERRSSHRTEISIRALVKGRESETDFWKEDTEIITLSRLGASFNLPQKCPVGRVLCLLLEMPIEFRAYDQDEEFYTVWGLVQHCTRLKDGSGFHIGVAFIGKHAPESYLDDPMKSFRVVGMDIDGFWHVGEAKSAFVSRAHHRFPCAIPVKLATTGKSKSKPNADDDAITENISVGGASIFSDLEVDSGDAVYFTCPENGFTTLCVVRNRQQRENDRTSVHVEFSDRFPIKDLNLEYEDELEARVSELEEESPKEELIDTDETVKDLAGKAEDTASEKPEGEAASADVEGFELESVAHSLESETPEEEEPETGSVEIE